MKKLLSFVFWNRGLHSMSPVQMKSLGGVFFYLVGSRLPNFPRLGCFRVVNIAPFFARLRHLILVHVCHIHDW